MASACLAQVPPEFRLSPEAGFPRSWEAGVQVSPHSVLNLFNGNVATELVLHPFGGSGPAVRFAIVHNSASSDSEQTIPQPGGFSLGPGWGISFGGGIVDNLDGTVDVVEDDGNIWTFELDSGDYVPPTGNHDHLTFDGVNDQWILTRPSQWKRVFDEDGRLLEVEDAAGMKLALQRDAGENHRITSLIASADPGDPNVPWEGLTFSYNSTTDLLETITSSGSDEWEFGYDGSGRLNLLTIVDSAAEIAFTYNNKNRIVTLDDDEGAYGPAGVYTYSYSQNRLVSLTDPDTAVQEFEYPTEMVGYPARWETTYTDRDEEEWTYHFDADGRLRERYGPESSAFIVTYDADNNYDSMTFDSGETVSLEWGPCATLEAVEFFDDLAASVHDVGQTWTQPDAVNKPNFWRLGTQFNSEGDLVTYRYDIIDPMVLNDMLETDISTDPNYQPDPNVTQDPHLAVSSTTSTAGGVRQFWNHVGRRGLQFNRAFVQLEATTVIPAVVPQQVQSVPLYSWRWRFTWVVPSLGCHIGIDHQAANGPKYVDYGQPADDPDECGCCVGFEKFTNNRWDPDDRVKVIGIAETAYQAGTENMRLCYQGDSNPSGRILPVNWGTCCQYHWLGMSAGGNSNSGAYKAARHCLGNSFTRPPAAWLLYAWGWSNIGGTPNNTEDCDGYYAEDWN